MVFLDLLDLERRHKATIINAVDHGPVEDLLHLATSSNDPAQHLLFYKLPTVSPTTLTKLEWTCLLTVHHRTGVLAIILCIALGIANIFSASLIIIFSIICL